MIFRNINLENYKQFLYFICLGLLVNGLGLTCFFILVRFLRLSPVITVAIVSPASVLLLYILQKEFVFQTRASSVILIPKYIMLYSSMYLTNLVLIYLLCEVWMFNPLLSQALILVVLGACSFLLTKILFEFS